MTKADERARFNTEIAPALAAQLGTTEAAAFKGSSRFAYFEDADRLVIVAGAQEGTDIQLALALGLTYRGDKKLALVLPRGHTCATQQRAPWLRVDAQPELHVHDGIAGSVEPLAMLSQPETIEALAVPRKGVGPADELRKASIPLHLDTRSANVDELVEWATVAKDLDPGHRRSERSWHYRGQRVLSIARTSDGLEIRAGIHTTGDPDLSTRVALKSEEVLSATDLDRLQGAVGEGIAARENERPGGYGKPDEHWLQAVIRAEPSLVGVEQPALREVPAWRPADGVGDKAKAWGRGFIDLVGVDGHGNIRVVETKLAANKDDLLIFQGLDYFVWAQAYKDTLRERLGVGPKSRIVLHYVIGTSPGTSGTESKLLSTHAAAQTRALDPVIEWRFQVIDNWYAGGDRPTANCFPPRTLPS